MTISVVIFDDNTFTRPEAVFNGVGFPKPLKISDVEETIDWHDVWNALGDLSEKKGKKNGKPLAENVPFEEALNWCRTFQGRAICFFDYFLGYDIAVNEQHVTDPSDKKRVNLDPALSFVSNTTSRQDAVRFFQHYQGLLLATTLAANADADADIWLMTGNVASSDVEKDAEKLQYIVGQNRIVSRSPNALTGTLKTAADSVVINPINRASEEFVRVRSAPSELADAFWPESAKGWFKNSTPPVPHNCPPALPDEVSNYLAKIGVSEEIGKKWHAQGRYLWEVLKQFVGACAVAHIGKTYNLPLGSLLLALSKAITPSLWTGIEEFQWQMALGGIAGSDKDRPQDLVEEAVKLFDQFGKKRADPTKLNEVRIEFKPEDDGLHLFVDFGFNCTVGREKAHRSLVAKSQVVGYVDLSGDSFKAVREFLRAADRAKGENGELFAAIYPVEKEGKVWTRLDFKARGS